MNYDLSSGKGYAVLLVYEKFKHANNRKGADIDLKNMQDITKALGLEQINQDNDKNLTRVDTLKVLKDAYSLITENDCQMFVFMISTHGKELPNPAASGQKDHALSCSDDEMIFLSTDVVKMFSEHNCPILKGKPKLFFIQACRSIDPTWYMVKGTEMMYPDCRMHITEDKTKVSVVRKKDTTSKTEQFIDVQDIAQINTSKNSDNIKEPREFHLVLKGGKGKEEFIASTQDHADAWVIGLCDLMIPDDSISRVSARRIKKDGNEEDGLLMLKKRWEHILWKCSSHVTGVDGGTGNQTIADSLAIATANKDETEVDAKGRNESASKVLGFTSPLSDNYKHTGTKNVVLSCETFSQEVKWEKDGKLIHSTTRVKIEDKEKVHQLTFAELEYGDSGIYICSNTDEKLTRISLIVGGFKKPLQDIYTNTGTNDVILSCENNIQNVKWEKDGKPIVSKDGKPIESTTRVKIEPNEFVHQLTFTEVEYGDTGTYTCSSSERWSTSASLIVGGFKKPLRDEYAKTGAKNVIFSCETYSPNVNWEKDGKPIGSTTRVKIEQKGFVHQLIFTEVEYGDTGNYTCSTPEGRTTSSTLIVGDSLTPKKWSWSASKRVFTTSCLDGSDLVIESNNLEETEQGDNWFNKLTYAMYNQSYGKDEGITLQTITSTKIQSGGETKQDGYGKDEGIKLQTIKSTEIQSGGQKKQDGDMESDSKPGNDTGPMTPQTTRTESDTKPGADAKSLSPQTTQGVTDSRQNIIAPIPRLVECNRDMLMMFAALSGKIAWRSKAEGSWLFACVIKALNEQKQNDAPVDLMSVLTTATGTMAEKEAQFKGSWKAVPVIEHRLLKALICKVQHLESVNND
ncbi:uncharacterized protein LOC128219829 isoform X2 [Mya arenaria]|uniref:uncharacterized protein LOC128219829 isoform X2 n=1 Tax=Mya arenaria TaxID=6604 RepID=UPI0022DF51BC|nr:uncharacterized protein LOC128219829 isoform X2 [Mya arenaria]